MFDNPEKLFIILVIALLIFGPQRLAGLGSTIGRTIRDFRNSVRDAQETFTSEFQQAASTAEPMPEALPAPDPVAPVQASDDLDPARAAEGPWEPPGEASRPAAQPADAELDGLSSLASEPTAEALRKSLTPKG
jgi:TatA/E family protein of Tat protein translocase